MARLTIDPGLIEAPDFTLEAYALTCDALAAAQGITPAEVANNLKAAWTTENDRQKERWEQQLQEDHDAEAAAHAAREEEEEQEKLRKDKEKREEQKERDKKIPKINALSPCKRVDTVIKDRPSRYAMKKLEDREYVELCYFTSESCKEASLHDHTLADGALAITSNTSSVAAFRPIGAYTASAKAIPDNLLTWMEMTRAKTNLLARMTEAGWDVEYTTALASFFVQLENHPRLQQGDGGKQVILEYQCQVRRDWHRELKDPSGKPAFDISIINDELIDKIDTRLTREENRRLTTQLRSEPTFYDHRE